MPGSRPRRNQDSGIRNQRVGTRRRVSASYRTRCYSRTIMGKRIFLFLLTNLAIVLTLTVVVPLGLGDRRRRFRHRLAGRVLSRLGHGRRVHLAADVALDRQARDRRAADRRPHRRQPARLAAPDGRTSDPSGESADAGSRRVRVAGGQCVRHRPEQEPQPRRGVGGPDACACGRKKSKACSRTKSRTSPTATWSR